MKADGQANRQTDAEMDTHRQRGGQTDRAAELPAPHMPLNCRTPKLIKDIAGAVLKRLVKTD